MSAPPVCFLQSPDFLRTGRIILVALANPYNSVEDDPLRPDELTIRTASTIINHLHWEFSVDFQKHKNAHYHQTIAKGIQHTAEETKEAFYTGDREHWSRSQSNHEAMVRLQKVRLFLETSKHEVVGERAAKLLKEAGVGFTYDDVMMNLLQYVEVHPGNIENKLAEAMKDVKSAILITIGHGNEEIQAKYAWSKILKPHVTQLDGAIFVCCQGDKSIKPSLSDLPIKSLTFMLNVSGEHIANISALTFFTRLYLSFVTTGWYGNNFFGMIREFLIYGQWTNTVDTSPISAIIYKHRRMLEDTPPEEVPAHWMYRAPTKPMQNSSWMTLLLEFANECSSQDRNSNLLAQNIEDVAVMHWNNDK